MNITEDIKRSSYLNELIFCAVLLIYSIWRFSKISKIKPNTYKSRMRNVGSFFIISSIISTFSYNMLYWFLSSKIVLDKSDFELVGFLRYSYMVKYREMNIDLSNLLNVTYLFSKIFRMSSIFMLLGLWGPCLYSFINADDIRNDIYKNAQLHWNLFITRNLFQTSIVSCSKIYSFIRIPIFIFAYNKLRTYGTSSLIFFESFFMSIEIYSCIALFLVLRTKHNFVSGYKGMDTITLLGVCLGLYGFLNYSINCLSFPFAVDYTSHQVIHSLVFALKLVIDLLLVNMFCPMKEQVFDDVENKQEKETRMNFTDRELVVYNK
ncbi:uncharacterized protein VNE69_03244 [Vairimorpha necatrix]|uniref:Membrane protein n=1 Tax=Vairimorpha necatrix TaxID=6039 RepID=A0AAX4JAX1_9MICR